GKRRSGWVVSGETQPLAVRGPSEAVVAPRRGGQDDAGRVRPIQDDQLEPSGFVAVEKRELLPIRRAPQVEDLARAFPALVSERASDPRCPRPFPRARALPGAGPVGPGDVLGELAWNPAHRRNSGQGSNHLVGK